MSIRSAINPISVGNTPYSNCFEFSFLYLHKKVYNKPSPKSDREKHQKKLQTV